MHTLASPAALHTAALHTPLIPVASAVIDAARETSRAAAAPTELFGSFLLGDDEFALPASCIREVVNYPERVTRLPLSPAFLEGMFTLRGTVIPVVNLGRLFNPTAPPAQSGHKIAIVDFQQVLVGIVFHDTAEILHVRPDQRSTLTYAAGAARGVIAGTILLDDGARLLQILDAAALVQIENVPQVLALQSAARKKSSLQFQAQGERRQCVSFRVGGTSFAFEMGAIQEIVRVPELQTSILNNRLCLGRLNFRGNPVAVIDFAALLETTPLERDLAAASDAREFTSAQRIVIARIDLQTVGFLVDSVDNIVHFFNDELLPIPLLSKARAGMFGGCIAKPDLPEIIFLNHREIFARGEIHAMHAGHASLYPEEAKAVATEAARQAGGKGRGQRKVYISFALEHSFAVEIKQVREIIDFSDAIVKAPGMPPFMRGMLNLRQQMISVIDLRSLYGMEAVPPTAQAKILVIERGDERYGLVVDAVQNIMTVCDSQRYPAPKMMRSQGGSSTDLRGEMDDVIDIDACDGAARKTLSVFQCDRLLQRLEAQLPATTV